MAVIFPSTYLAVEQKEPRENNFQVADHLAGEIQRVRSFKEVQQKIPEDSSDSFRSYNSLSVLI